LRLSKLNRLKKNQKISKIVKLRNFISISFFLILMSIANTLYAQYKIGVNSYGTIINNDTSAISGVIGTGFAIDSSIIVSSYHLFKNSKQAFKYYRVGHNHVARLKLSDSLPDYDIAILKCHCYLTNLPFQLGDFKNIKKGDRINYVGYDKLGASILCIGYISKIDSTKLNGVWLHRLKIISKDPPCHPGSPIINSKGKTVAMVSSMSSENNHLLVLVAYSIMQLNYTRYEGF